jgi:hypothetical protein
MGCLKNGVVANVVVPHPNYVRFAAHFGFRPDFCEAADPESKRLVENLVAYAKSAWWSPPRVGAVGWPTPTGRRESGAWRSTVESTARLRRSRLRASMRNGR